MELFYSAGDMAEMQLALSESESAGTTVKFCN